MRRLLDSTPQRILRETEDTHSDLTMRDVLRDSSLRIAGILREGESRQLFSENQIKGQYPDQNLCLFGVLEINTNV